MDDEVSSMLAPVIALVIWTLILQLCKNAQALRAVKRDRTMLTADVRDWPATPNGVVEDNAGSSAHNHHLVEQPSLFYAIVISMALLHTHGNSVTNLVLAWAYVLITVAHSLVQGTSTGILYRFVLFSLASVALLGLALHAAVHAW